MRTVGIIAEYNPLHTGHAYQLSKAKELAGADYAIVVMSPDYVQRGEPALFDKYQRCAMALKAGADLVIELPVCYACGSAQYFAEGAVATLDALSVVDALCFGTEEAKADDLSKLARILNSEPASFRTVLKEKLSSGLSFPQARSEALRRCLRDMDYAKEEIAAMLRLIASPNNILGVEYLRALQKFDSAITALPLARRGSAYDSDSLSEEFCSAGAIRSALKKGCSLQFSADENHAGSYRREWVLKKDLYEKLAPFIPEDCRTLFREACHTMVLPDDFLPVLNRELLYTGRFDAVLDISGELSDRIRSQRRDCVGKSFSQIVSRLKTKQITEAHIRRALLHLILGIGREETENFRSAGPVFYAHLLGFSKSAEPLLHEIKKKSALPLLTKAAQAPSILKGPGLEMWKLNVAASDLYSSITSANFGLPFRSEYEHSPIIL